MLGQESLENLLTIIKFANVLFGAQNMSDRGKIRGLSIYTEGNHGKAKCWQINFVNNRQICPKVFTIRCLIARYVLLQAFLLCGLPCLCVSTVLFV